MNIWVCVFLIIVSKTYDKNLSLVGGVKELSGVVAAGDRLDNQWLQYNSSSLPRTQQDWDSCVFVEKTHWGYYCWPRFSFVVFNHFSLLDCPLLSWYFYLYCYLSDNIFHLVFIYHHLITVLQKTDDVCTTGGATQTEPDQRGNDRGLSYTPPRKPNTFSNVK